MSYHLVAHLPVLVCWGGDQLLSIALLYCIILYYHVMLSYYIALSYQGQHATKKSHGSAGETLLSYSK